MKTLLLHPFEKYSDHLLLITGLSFSFIGVLLAFAFNARFDGFLDLHFVEETTLSQSLLEVLFNIFSGTLVFYIVGRLINNKTRLIDILSVCMIAKIPFYIIPLLNINSLVYNTTIKMTALIHSEKANGISTADLSIMMAVGIIMILILIWTILLLFNGFKIATNAKETKHTLFFILGIIITEIISKYLIITFIK